VTSTLSPGRELTTVAQETPKKIARKVGLKRAAGKNWRKRTGVEPANRCCNTLILLTSQQQNGWCELGAGAARRHTGGISRRPGKCAGESGANARAGDTDHMPSTLPSLRPRSRRNPPSSRWVKAWSSHNDGRIDPKRRSPGLDCDAPVTARFSPRESQRHRARDCCCIARVATPHQSRGSRDGCGLRQPS